jgi:prepilin-type N-terminal cleavage/methylation domain-containing protein
MTDRKGFTLVELLVVIAIIAVLLAILMPSLTGTKATAKRLQCSSRLSGMGKAFDMYVTHYDGKMPTIEWHTHTPPSVESYYILAKIRSNPYWCHHGCFFGAGFLDSGMLYYCPATEGWLEDYKKNCKNNKPWGDPGGWETDQALKSKKGYVYWPMSKEDLTSQQYADMRSSSRVNYRVGFPVSPTAVTDLRMNRALMADYSFHMVKGSGWTVNSLFPDGHVIMQPQPKDDMGLGMWHSESNPFPAGASRAGVAPAPVKIVEFMYKLQP